MSRSFDTKLDKMSTVYQAFSICALQVCESSKIIADNFLICGKGNLKRHSHTNS